MLRHLGFILEAAENPNGFDQEKNIVKIDY